MKRSAVAKRYARAVLDYIGSLEATEKLADQLSLFAGTIDECKDLKEVFANPTFMKHRKGVVEAVAKELKFDGQAVRILVFLLERKRIGQLADIAEAVRDLVEDRMQRVRAEVISKGELPADRYDRIRKALEGITGKKVVLKKKIEEGVIGGVITRVGSVVYDGSIRSQLDQFRTSLGKES